MSNWDRQYSALKYSIRMPRYGNHVEIWVREDPGGVSRWRRRVCLRSCFWHFNSAKTRLENARYKAEKVADKLANRARYVNHDYDLFDERFGES